MINENLKSKKNNDNLELENIKEKISEIKCDIDKLYETRLNRYFEDESRLNELDTEIGDYTGKVNQDEGIINKNNGVINKYEKTLEYIDNDINEASNKKGPDFLKSTFKSERKILTSLSNKEEGEVVSLKKLKEEKIYVENQIQKLEDKNNQIYSTGYKDGMYEYLKEQSNIKFFREKIDERIKSYIQEYNECLEKLDSKQIEEFDLKKLEFEEMKVNIDIQQNEFVSELKEDVITTDIVNKDLKEQSKKEQMLEER